MTEVNHLPESHNPDPDDRLVVVSVDSHVGPHVAEYRPYCEAKYLADLEEFVADIDSHLLITPRKVRERSAADGERATSERRERYEQAMVQYSSQELNSDGKTRIAHMDSDGIAAEFVFHGGMNLQPIPFFSPSMSATFNQDIPEDGKASELRAAGIRMYNRWLADWIQIAPERFGGLAHIPMWDVVASVAEVEWASAAGLRGVNLPSPRPGLKGYNDPVWDRLWATCSDLGMALHTHGGGGNIQFVDGVGASAIRSAQVCFAGRQGLPHLIFGGVFERFPNLIFVLTEQSGGWVVDTLQTLDSGYLSPTQEGEVPYIRDFLPRLPSEYFRSNCYVGGSFMARFEAEAAISNDYWKNLLWGRDFPHREGTWPYTKESMRDTFSGLPEEPARAMLGETALRVFGLDEAKIRAIARKIGPTFEAVNQPLDRIPADHLSFSFRKVGAWA